MEQLIDFVVENYIWIIIVGIVILMTVIGYIADKTDFGKKSNKKVEKHNNSNDEEKVVSEENIVQENAIVEENIESTYEIPEMEVAEEIVENPVEENVEPVFEMPEMTFDEMEETPVELNEVEENVEPVFEMPEMEVTEEIIETPIEENVEPAFETDEMENLEEPVLAPVVEEQEDVLDKKALKKLQKEEAKRQKDEARRQKEEAKKAKKEKKELEEEPVQQIENDEVSGEPTTDLFESMEEPTLEVEQEEVPVVEKEEPEYNGIEDITEIDLPSIESLDQELSNDTEEDDVWKF